MSSDSIFRFQAVSYVYPDAQQAALRDFSLDIPNGSVTAILGPNGAGKTTLLHLALGWLHSSGGQIEMDGKPLHAYTRREMGRWIALVPQSEAITFEYSLLEYVSLGRAPHLPPLAQPTDEDFNISLQALEQVGLGALSGRSIMAISGGERQRALIARALAQQPRILLLDEPTSHLDISNKGRLLAILRRLQADGVSIILTTHEPDIAAAIATQLVLMREGQILESGSLQESFTTPALSRVYGQPVEVATIGERRVALWN
jgi:iron complex transport system ATP-binding protein